MTTIRLPYEFTPREYQEPIFKALFYEGKRRIISVWHRRAGKDKSYINLITASVMQRVGTYLYLFPELNQARRVIWKGIDRDGKRFLDHFPQELIKSINSTDMRIEFINGSIFQLAGSDRYDSLMGTNPVGIIFSEYSLQNPMAWHYLRPILAENGGWAAFNFTPRGENHAYDLYEAAKDNKDWHVELLTVKDTKRSDGKPVISPEMIKDEIDSGMPKELIQQEFFCSFTVPLPGAYYSDLLMLLTERKQIQDFAIEPTLPVYTFWDLGVADAMSVWFMQEFHGELRMVNYIEKSGESLVYFKNALEQFRDNNKISYAEHWAPHDIVVRELSTGMSRLVIARNMGLHFRIAPKLSIADGIHAVKTILPKVWFHKTNCRIGVNALKSYHRDYNSKNRVFNDKPKHDWSSHGADAFRYFAVSWKPKALKQNQESQITMKDWSL